VISVRLAVLLAGAACLSLLMSSDFAGTWKRDDSKTRLTPTVTLTIEAKTAGCAVSGQRVRRSISSPTARRPGPAVFDHATYRRIDPHTIEQQGTRDGAPAGKNVWTVSADGKELHQLSDGTYANGMPYHTDSYFKRVGSVVGQDPLIGTWEAEPGRTMFGVAVI
jgi:hypothetical protein